MLTDRQILAGTVSGSLTITPLDPASLQPTSYDLTLDREFRVPRRGIAQIDLADMPEDGYTDALRVDNQGIVLEPGDFVLGCTREQVRLSGSVAARVEGKSSLGRVGLLVHATAGFIDPGFHGQITLEFFNAAPWELVLYPGMKIAQIAFFGLAAVPDRLYGSAGNHYLGQQGPVESRYQHVVASTDTKENVT